MYRRVAQSNIVGVKYGNIEVYASKKRCPPLARTQVGDMDVQRCRGYVTMIVEKQLDEFARICYNNQADGSLRQLPTKDSGQNHSGDRVGIVSGLRYSSVFKTELR